MTTTINASTSSGIVATADGSGILKVQSNGVTTNALAWVNFNGTTSPGTIRAAYNVGSVTKNGTGDYTINFTNALSDANYAVSGSGSDSAAGSGSSAVSIATNSNVTTSSVRITVTNFSTNLDRAYVAIIIFGN